MLLSDVAGSADAGPTAANNRGAVASWLIFSCLYLFWPALAGSDYTRDYHPTPLESGTRYGSQASTPIYNIYQAQTPTNPTKNNKKGF